MLINACSGITYNIFDRVLGRTVGLEFAYSFRYWGDRGIQSFSVFLDPLFQEDHHEASNSSGQVQTEDHAHAGPSISRLLHPALQPDNGGQQKLG